MRCFFRSHYRDYKLNQIKVDDSDGIYGSETSYESCWSRICNPDRSHVLKDVLRGLLVLIVLAIIVTVIFLLCYFLLTDIENKEDEAINTLIKEFSSGDPKFSIKDVNQTSPNESEIYISGSPDADPNKDISLQDITSGKVDSNDVSSSNVQTEVKVLTPSSPASGKTGENLEIVKPPFLISEVQPSEETAEGGTRPEEVSVVVPPDGFVPLGFPASIPPGHEGQPGQPAGDAVSELESAFSQDPDIGYDDLSEFVVANSGAECVPLRLELCSSSMPWALTAFPNWVNNNNIDELHESLKYFQSTIVGSRCAMRATEYSCTILEPACGPDGIPLPPCKSFCEDIVSACSDYLVNGNEHNIAFKCDRFPASKDPNVCVNINKASTVSTDSKLTAATGDLSEQGTNQPKDSTDVSEVPSDDSFDIASGREAVADTDALEEPTFTDDQDDTLNESAKDDTDSAVVAEVTNANEGVSTELPIFICDHTKFLCEDGSDCLPQEAICDGTQHCLDNSDEQNCTQAETSASDDTLVAEIGSDIFQTEPPSSLKPSRRPSLSEMLSSSALVAIPESEKEAEPPKTALKLRFSSNTSVRATKAKSLESTSKPNRNSVVESTSRPQRNSLFRPFSRPDRSSLLRSTSRPNRNSISESTPRPNRKTSPSFGPFSFTVRPSMEDDNSPKLSLASLLSTSIAPSQTPVAAHSENYPIIVIDEEPFPSASRRTLSDLLAEASVTSFPSRTPVKECPELQCLDGTCISVSQLNDGVQHCADGADEQR